MEREVQKTAELKIENQARSKFKEHGRRVTVRFTEKQWEILNRKGQKHKMSLPELLRGHFFKPKAFDSNVDQEMLKNLNADLNKIGANINQTLKILNSSNQKRIPGDLTDGLFQEKENIKYLLTKIKKELLL